MIWLLGIGRWLREAASALFGFAVRNPWPAAVIALCALSLWLWQGKRSETRRADSWHLAWKAQKAASDAAAAAQRALNAKIAAGYKDTSNAAQIEHDESAPRVRDATDRHIADRRLQAGQCGAGRSDPATQGADPAVPASVPAPALVAIDESDVQACADWTRIGVGAHNMAVDLITQGLAEAGE